MREITLGILIGMTFAAGITLFKLIPEVKSTNLKVEYLENEVKLMQTLYQVDMKVIYEVLEMHTNRLGPVVKE